MMPKTAGGAEIAKKFRRNPGATKESCEDVAVTVQGRRAANPVEEDRYLKLPGNYETNKPHAKAGHNGHDHEGWV